MGMTIDEAVLELRWLKKVNQEILETDVKELDVDSAWIKHWECVTQALDIAIDTARKYQIMQADYENRLKADMVAMLTEIQLEIEESENCGKAFHLGLQMASNIIQQKINELPPVTPQEPRWIPVDDPYTELPKKDLWVTRNDNGNLCVDKIYYDMTEWNDYIGDVVAYMEYKEPVPYKEVMEE